MVRIDLLYGKNGLVLDLPESLDVTVIRKHPMAPIEDETGAVYRALDNPMGCPPLSELARHKKTACILICDITRPVPNGILLPPLIDTLTRAGMDRKNILILVATGLHRPNEGKELREIIGSDEIFETIPIKNHFARNRAAHVDLGTTANGIPMGIDRRFVEADLKIITGLVEPHFMAGYSGGRKVVAPGVAFQDTILTFHTAHILEHPKAANCILSGNPLHEAQLEIVRAIGPISALNVAIDENRRMGFINFGAIEESHLQAVDFMREHAEVAVQEPFKTVVTTSAGYPLDKTYYQTVKGMVGVLNIVAPGGDVIIAGECSEGMGSPEFVLAQRLLCRLGPEAFMAKLRTREKALIDEWQTEMLVKALRKGTIHLFTTGLSSGDLKDIYINPASSVLNSVLESVRKHKDNRVAVVPEGPYVVPRITPPI
ncbi:MAG: nickel-dependent lactate racemase [Deltaproteobacteria bacterium]|nr:nickel-dependent lactate racemase [Deltaproteobacteria bacterium]